MLLSRALPPTFLVVLALVATACSSTVSVPTDAVACVYGAGGRDGLDLKDQVLPGSEPFSVKDGRVVVEVPTSDRFYLITSNDETRDPGAPAFVEAIDDGRTPVRWEVQARFVFNAAAACTWFNQHGLRNAVETEELRYDMQFNGRGGITPWLQWLAENFAVALDRTVGRVSQNYPWENLFYDYAVGSDTLGNLPDDASEEDRQSTLEAAEADLTEAFTDRLNARIGTDDGIPFFCGIGHNQATPEECAPIQIEIVDVRPVEASLVTDRAEIDARQAALDNARDLEALAAEQTALDDAARERAEAAAIADAQSQAQITAAELRAELGITDEDIDVLELEVLKAQREAAELVAPCTQVQVSGLECVLLLAVLNGTDLPTVLGDLGSSAQIQIPTQVDPPPPPPASDGDGDGDEP